MPNPLTRRRAVALAVAAVVVGVALLVPAARLTVDDDGSTAQLELDDRGDRRLTSSAAPGAP